MFNLKPLAVAVGVALGSLTVPNAMADVFSIDANPFVKVSGVLSGAFEDFFTFVIGPSDPAMNFTVNVASLESSLGDLKVLGIGDQVLELIKDEGGTPTIVGTGSWGTNATFSSLTSGSYAFRVAGATNGLGGGLYSFASQAAPVPEPGTWAMLATGGILLGFGLRRKYNA